MNNRNLRIIQGLASVLLVSFLSCNSNPKMADPQGNEYGTVKIENQIWITENLKYAIEEESFCYDDLEAECDSMGRLYTWEGAVKAASEIPGWHLPTKDEWDSFIEHFGSDTLAFEAISSDEIGFNFQPAGAKLPNGKYIAKKYKMVNYWSSTECDTSSLLAYSIGVLPHLEKTSPHNYPKVNAASVRLVKD